MIVFDDVPVSLIEFAVIIGVWGRTGHQARIIRERSVFAADIKWF